MRLYDTYVLPRLLDRDMQWEGHEKDRADILKDAAGIVLEIGFGSGLNIPSYPAISMLYALEPSKELWELAAERVSDAKFPITYLKASAEHIPLPDHSVDTVVSTWTLCSIPDPRKALAEVRRVLRPDGSFIFVEHGLSSSKRMAVLQRLLTPPSRLFCGNCHLDRDIGVLVRESGLSQITLETFPEEGRPIFFSYRGVAKA